MNTQTNPFTSATFEKIWMKHFQPSGKVRAFDCIEGIRFYKSGFWPVYVNTGKNLTKGNHYRVNEGDGCQNKVFVIYDVQKLPASTEIPLAARGLKRFKSIQYPGFIIQLDPFSSLDEYLLATFGKSSRMKLRKYSNRLDSCFEIRTKMHLGHIDRDEYDTLFEQFMELLVKRYSDKEISYNNMQPKEWNFYREVAYSLILEKKASLFVVYERDTPIAITYNYHHEGTLIDAITVFDIDYSKFNLGYVNNLKLIEWCLDNQVTQLDFSKGYFDYKKRLCNVAYDFEYHILYDSRSPLALAIAFCIQQFFSLKQYLRRKNINELFHKFTFLLQKARHKDRTMADLEYTFLDTNEALARESLVEADPFDADNPALKRALFEFLYLTQETLKETRVFCVDPQRKRYLINGKKKSQLLALK